MNCIEFRQLKLADPGTPNEEANDHKARCTTCAGFERDIHKLDDTIHTALSVAVPEGFAAKVLLNQSLQSHPRRPTRWYWLSMAASFFLVIFIFQLSPVDALDDEIITHLDNEAHQVHGKTGNIAEPEIRRVLLAVGGDLHKPIGKVTYASECLMDGQLVAHFVVENSGNPYTLIVIPQSSKKQITFKDKNWRGIITPHATGTIAVIAHTGEKEMAIDLQKLSQRYERSIKRVTI